MDENNNLLTNSNKFGSYTSDHILELSTSERNRELATNTSKELFIIIKSSLPLIVTLLLQYSLTVFSIFSVGKLGKKELASVSLATITYNVTVSIFNGMATSLDTYCAQAHGAGNYPMVSIYFQRCSAMILITSIPIIAFWCFSASILKYVVPEKELLLLAQQYLRYLSLGTPGYIMFETGKRFLQCQGIYSAGQYCLFLVAPLNIILNLFLVWNKDHGLGFIGAPISIVISYWMMSLLLLMYVVFIDGKKCWFGLKLKLAFNVKEWTSMFSLALNGTAMLLSEFIAFEILTLSASRFGTTALAAQSIASTMATLSFQLPFGVSIALSTRVAQHIGLQNLLAAVIANKVTYALSGLLGLSSCLFLVSCRYFLASCFTSDSEVIIIGLRLISILGVNQLYDCPNVILAGCLRGQGRQKIGSLLNLFAYYVVAVPLALTLAFCFKLTLVGLWVGIGVGIVTLAACEFWFVYHSNWEEILERSRQRISE